MFALHPVNVTGSESFSLLYSVKLPVQYFMIPALQCRDHLLSERTSRAHVMPKSLERLCISRVSYMNNTKILSKYDTVARMVADQPLYCNIILFRLAGVPTERA